MLKRHHLLALTFTVAMVAVTVPPARPQTPPPAPPQAPPGFDLAFAMNALYGNYNAATGASISGATATGPEFMNFPPGQKIKVKPFFAAASSITGEVFIATYSVPADGEFDCHACAPLLGLAVFQKSGTTWKIEASEKPDIIFGQYGNPPTAQLFQFGERHIGIQLNNTDGGQGVMDTLVMLLVSWNGGFSQAWSDLVSSDDAMYCGPQATSPCYGYKVDLKFVKGANPEYDDLILTTSGTDLTDDATPVVKNVSGVVHLKFSDGKYIPADSR